MTQLIDLITPYDLEKVIFNKNKTTCERDNFFKNANSKGLNHVFQGIQQNINGVFDAAYQKNLNCFLKLHGFNSKNVDENTGEFIGLYLGVLGDNSYRTDRKPNVQKGGKLMGIDLSKGTINFQLFSYDSNRVLHPRLQSLSGTFPIENGSQRIKLTTQNIQAINDRLFILQSFLKA